MANIVQLVDVGDNPIDKAIGDDATGDYRGYVLFGVRDDSGSALAPDGKFHPVTIDENGRLWVRDLNVGGKQPEGQPVVQNPVFIAGVDDDGKVRGIHTDGGGFVGTFVINGVVGRNDQVDVFQQPRDVKWAEINITATGDTQVLAGVGGKQLRILRICFTCSVNNSVGFKSNTTYKINPMDFLARNEFMVDCTSGGFFVQTEVGEAFKMNMALAGKVRGFINYVEVD